MIRAIKKQIMAKLRAINPRVYGEKADDDAVFPYQVFSFPSNLYREGAFAGYLDIDVWDRSDSSAVVDEICDQIMTSLDRFCYIDNDVQMTLHLYNLLTVEPDDKTLRRKTVIFEIHFRRIT